MAASWLGRSPWARLCLLASTSSSRTSKLKLKSLTTGRSLQQCDLRIWCQGQASRCFSTSAESSYTTATNSSSAPASSGESQHVSKYRLVQRESYIPVTRQSLVRYLIEDKELLTEDERRLFSDFVLALDIVLVNKYHGVLEDLKILFDPSNPDKETLKSRELSRKEKLDNEFSLLQLLDEVLSRANFRDLPSKTVEQALRIHETRGKVRVSVDPNKFDVLHFWVLGHEVPKVQLSFLQKSLQRLLRRPSQKPVEYYKRVVLALRLKKDTKLILKVFKEVPVDGLEMLLPDGRIHMPLVDKTLLVSSVAVTGVGCLAKLVAYLAGVQVDWTLAMSLVSGALGFLVWSRYTDRRNAYLADVARTLYFKMVTSNRALLSVVVDRAEDESLKEALLAYVFLLNSQSHDLRNKVRSMFVTLPPGGLSVEELESSVEKWLQRKTGAHTRFNSAEAVQFLKQLGLVYEQNNKYHVQQLDVAARHLPQAPRSVISRRSAQADVTEGYDRDEHLETSEEYVDEEHRSRRYGWF
ncbi:hypothetical protein BsWGS_16563 [Bradybaena similaris]